MALTYRSFVLVMYMRLFDDCLHILIRWKRPASFCLDSYKNTSHRYPSMRALRRSSSEADVVQKQISRYQEGQSLGPQKHWRSRWLSDQVTGYGFWVRFLFSASLKILLSDYFIFWAWASQANRFRTQPNGGPV